MSAFGLALATLLVPVPPATATTYAAPNDHLQYFGYWQSGRPADGSSYLKDTAGYSNLAWTGVGDLERDARGVAASARQAGMKLFVDVEDFLVEDYQETAGLEARWTAFRDKLKPFSGDIAFFMLASEPEGGEYPWANKGDWIGKVKPIFEKWHQRLNTAFPAVPTFINYTADRAHDWAPPYLFEADVVGFDQYFCWDKCYGGLTLTEAVQELERKFPAAKIMLVPTAHARADQDKAADEKVAIDYAAKYYALAKSDQRIIGMLPWNWWSVPGMMVGAKDLPDLRDRFAGIGKEIIAPKGLGTVCVDVKPEAENPYFVASKDGERWGWNGSHCWDGHAPGVYSVVPPGGTADLGSLELRPGATIHFSVSFSRAGAPPNPGIPPKPPTGDEDAAEAFLAAVYPGKDRAALARETGDTLASPERFRDYLESLTRTGSPQTRDLARELIKDKDTASQLLASLRGWFARQMGATGMVPVPIGGTHPVDPRLRTLTGAGPGKDAATYIASMFASMDATDRKKLIDACYAADECNLVQACIDTKLYDKCLAACTANPQCTWPGSEPGETSETDENCSAPNNKQGSGRAAEGKGEVCVETSEGKAYFVVGPDQTWGWNGPKCFPGHTAGVYSVNTDGGYGYPKVGDTDVRAKISPRSATLTNGGTLKFSVHFCGHGYARPN